MVCSEVYVKALEYKALNSILYTNANLQLHKIGYITDDHALNKTYKINAALA